MVLCGTLFRVSAYVLVALVAVLTFFHLECQKEKEADTGDSKFNPFDPKQTDTKDVPLCFCKKGDVTILYTGFEFILMQSAPCALVKLVSLIRGMLKKQEDLPDFCEQNELKKLVNITIYDARKKPPGTFHESGFTLIELDKEPETQDWRTSSKQKDADILKFFDQMEPHIKWLYPDAKRIEWTHNVVRGGDRFGDQPKALKPHMDYYQDDDARLEFHKDRPVFSPDWLGVKAEANYLMGEMDRDDSKLGALLGIWKPLHPSKVCDYPLAVMDARTIESDEVCPWKNSINLGLLTFNNLASTIVHSPEQRWYYYSFQNTREVLIFHQYSKGKFFSNPHTSFLNKNCPEDTEPRISVEMKLAVFF